MQLCCPHLCSTSESSSDQQQSSTSSQQHASSNPEINDSINTAMDLSFDGEDLDDMRQGMHDRKYVCLHSTFFCMYL